MESGYKYSENSEVLETVGFVLCSFKYYQIYPCKKVF